MIEAAEKNQVRYYGLNKIDKKLVDAYNKKLNPDSKTKKEKKEKQTLQEKYISVVVKINKMKNNIDKASTKVEKNILKKELEELETKKTNISNEINKHKDPNDKKGKPHVFNTEPDNFDEPAYSSDESDNDDYSDFEEPKKIKKPKVKSMKDLIKEKKKKK